MQLFTAVATMFFKKSKTKIAHENMKKPPSKVAQNRPFFSSNLNFCSIKISHHATSL